MLEQIKELIHLMIREKRIRKIHEQEEKWRETVRWQQDEYEYLLEMAVRYDVDYHDNLLKPRIIEHYGEEIKEVCGW